MNHPSSRNGGRILLVGAGHAHLHLIANAEALTSAGHTPTVVGPAEFWYSGAATGVLAGLYPPALDRVDVATLAARHGVEHVRDRVVGADPSRREVRLESGRTLGYDVLSVNVGSVPGDGPKGSREHAVPVKPLPMLLELAGTLRNLAVERRPVRVVVMGGGPSGCEVALALDSRARREGAAVRITLVTLEEVLAELPGGARRSMRRALAGRGVEVVEGTAVAEVREDRVILADGSALDAAIIVDATGLQPAPVVGELGLALGPRGGLLVDRHLRAPGDPRVLGAGDCVDLAGAPLPHVGVYAVRQGPILLDNLLATLAGRPLRPFVPQKRYLLVLALGDGTGLAVRGRLWGRGRWAFHLKDRIDRRFIRRFQADG